MMEPVVQIEGLVKSYGSKVAVNGISFCVQVGEIFAFLGPNGAGKTTTIKLMAGLLHPDHGSIRICGHPMGLNGISAKQHVAYVPDQPFVYDKLTGREFLRFVREMYRVPTQKAREHIDQMVVQLNMSEFLDRLCEGYSHGMKQKLVLTAALLHDPTVLVIDEPMVGLDPRTVRAVRDLFVERARRGKSVFMSTHTLAVAEAVAHRIGIIHQGSLIRIGTFSQLQAEAEHRHSLEEIFLKLTEHSEVDLKETIP